MGCKQIIKDRASLIGGRYTRLFVSGALVNEPRPDSRPAKNDDIRNAMLFLTVKDLSMSMEDIESMSVPPTRSECSAPGDAPVKKRMSENRDKVVVRAYSGILTNQRTKDCELRAYLSPDESFDRKMTNDEKSGGGLEIHVTMMRILVGHGHLRPDGFLQLVARNDVSEAPNPVIPVEIFTPDRISACIGVHTSLHLGS